MAKALNRKIQCTRCNHKWKVRGSLPKMVKFCPNCHSPYWNMPKGFLKRGRPKKLIPIEFKVYNEHFRFDLDFDSIKEYRKKHKQDMCFTGSRHNKEHMKMKSRIIRGIYSPNNKRIKDLDYCYNQLKKALDLSSNSVDRYGIDWCLDFYIAPKYFDLVDPVEKKLCYSLVNLRVNRKI